MASFTTFLLVYLFGGLTFLPLVVVVVIYLTTRPVLPNPSPAPAEAAATTPEKKRAGSFAKDDFNYDGLVLPGDDVKALESVRREHAKHREHRADRSDDFATAGYFAVHRKYVAMGVNSKPIEPGSVGPAPVAPPSPSVYQTFFRTMLNKKTDADGVEASNAASPRPKNARNMYYVVLRHGHLILFDDDQQVDVRHVIKLEDHDVRISSGSSSTSATPEGELFIKRNAIHLAPKTLQRAKAHNAPVPQPWFFYCENCSEKEDFYFSLLRSQKDAPQPHDIDVRHLTALMERLHASPEAAEMRWLNAVVGRLFLGVCKTPDILHFVQSKIVTKLSRIPRPSFIASLHVQRVDVGETTPQITSPRLKSLTAEGECIVEADVRYSGRIEIDVAALLRMSTPIGQQEVKTSLAVVLTHLEGHVLLKIKAPPSNRVWFSFRHMPKVEMDIRPIVMARQLTWPVFLQMIEGKIKEAIAESIVLPFWDDTPFFSTEKKTWRGGLWNDPTDKGPTDKTHDGGMGTATSDEAASTTTTTGSDIPGEENVSPAVLRLRRLSKAASSSSSNQQGGTLSSAASVHSMASDKASPMFKKLGKKNQSTVDLHDSPKLPSRASTVSTASEPVVGTERVHAESALGGQGAQTAQTPPPLKSSQTSSSAISWLSSGTLRKKASNMSMEASDAAAADDRPVSSSASDARPRTASAEDIADTLGVEGGLIPVTPAAAHSTPRAATFASPSLSSSSPNPPLSRKKSFERAATTVGAMSPDAAGGDPHNAKTGAVLAAAMTGAAQSAKRWGINALQRRATAVAERKAKAELELRKGSAELDLTKPMGGGIPLPPLGEPLPLPSQLHRTTTDAVVSSSSAAASPEMKIRRKKVHTPQQQQPRPTRAGSTSSPSTTTSSNESIGRRRRADTDDSNATAPPLPTRPSRPSQDIFVIAAPSDSEPEEETNNEGNSPPSGGFTKQNGSVILEEEHEGGEGEGEGGDDVVIADDDAQWGELAESVMSAFMEDSGQAGTVSQPAPAPAEANALDAAADTLLKGL